MGRLRVFYVECAFLFDRWLLRTPSPVTPVPLEDGEPEPGGTVVTHQHPLAWQPPAGYGVRLLAQLTGASGIGRNLREVLVLRRASGPEPEGA